MAEQNTYVNYNNFSKHINGMVSNGQTLKTNINDAYTALASGVTNGSWKGKNYDKIVALFNELLDGSNGSTGLNMIAKSVGETIPAAMANIANSWSEYDQNPTNLAQPEKMNLVTKLTPSNQTELTYKPAEVDLMVKKIINGLNSAEGNIAEISNQIKGMSGDWQGTDYDNNKADITKWQGEVSSDVKEMIDKLQKYFAEDKAEYERRLQASSNALQTK